MSYLPTCLYFHLHLFFPYLFLDCPFFRAFPVSPCSLCLPVIFSFSVVLSASLSFSWCCYLFSCSLSPLPSIVDEPVLPYCYPWTPRPPIDPSNHALSPSHPPRWAISIFSFLSSCQFNPPPHTHTHHITSPSFLSLSKTYDPYPLYIDTYPPISRLILNQHTILYYNDSLWYTLLFQNNLHVSCACLCLYAWILLFPFKKWKMESLCIST